MFMAFHSSPRRKPVLIAAASWLMIRELRATPRRMPAEPA